MKNFNYIKPETLDEAGRILADLNDDAMALAGGTDLLVRMRSKTLAPKVVVDIKGINELTQKEENDSGLVLGSTLTISEIEKWDVIQKRYPVLSDAAATLGGPQIRNKATVGGNLCNASPSADMSPALMALNATVSILSKSGEIKVALDDFFKGPGETVLGSGEILTTIHVPKMPENSHAVYLKQGRRKAMEIAVAAVGVMLTMDETCTRCQDVRIVMGAVAPVPLRAAKAEAMLRGIRLEEELILTAARTASQECSPISDVRASAWYREKVIEGLVKKALTQSLQVIRNSKKATGGK